LKNEASGQKMGLEKQAKNKDTNRVVAEAKIIFSDLHESSVIF